MIRKSRSFLRIQILKSNRTTTLLECPKMNRLLLLLQTCSRRWKLKLSNTKKFNYKSRRTWNLKCSNFKKPRWWCNKWHRSNSSKVDSSSMISNNNSTSSFATSQSCSRISFSFNSTRSIKISCMNKLNSKIFNQTFCSNRMSSSLDNRLLWRQTMHKTRCRPAPRMSNNSKLLNQMPCMEN